MPIAGRSFFSLPRSPLCPGARRAGIGEGGHPTAVADPVVPHARRAICRSWQPIGGVPSPMCEEDEEDPSSVFAIVHLNQEA
jgi:hypothetical protein